MRNLGRLIAICALTPVLSGCLTVADRQMASALKFSQSYEHTLQQNDKTPQGQWWTHYGDDELNAIMTAAFANNPNLNIIRARLNQSKALTRQSVAPLLPSITATGDRGTTNGGRALPSDFNAGAMASFEIDIWGKNRATLRANDLNAQASAEDLHAATITLSASIVEEWLDILSLLEQEALVKKQIAINKTILELQQKRFALGAAQALDVLQQQETLARSETLLPDILSAQKQAANNIAILVGKMPGQNLQISQKSFPDMLPIPNNGMPSDLLANRPDILAAWLRLISADWAIKAAWADRLPQFDLSANYTTSSTALSTLFNTWLLDLTASLTAPIFDGGSRRAEQWRQEAIADERFHQYRETVLNAVGDVENALVRNRYQDEKLEALNRQLIASQQTLERAQISYSNGSSTYINVLNSLNNTQSLEQQIVQEHLLQAKERVRLYRALGGRNWAQNIDVEKENSTENKDIPHDGK